MKRNIIAAIIVVLCIASSFWLALSYRQTQINDLKRVLKECSEKIYEANMGHQVSNPCLETEGLY